MSAPTFSQLLDTYLNALNACGTNQSYTIDGRTFTRAELPEIRNTITWLQQQIAQADISIDQTGTGFVLVDFN